MIDENGNIDDMIDIITKKTVPIKKENLGGKKKSSKKPNNPPPKRYKPDDQLFVQGQVSEVQQQQKLQKIAESIGGFASQVVAKENKDIYDMRSNSLVQGSRINKDFYNPLGNDASMSNLSNENL